MTGAEHIEIALAQPFQAGEIAGERPWTGSDEHAPFAQNRVPGETHPAGDQREVVGGVSRRRDGLKGPKAAPFGKRDVGAGTTRRKRRRIALAQSSNGFGVIGVIVSEHDASEATARIDRVE